MSKNIALIARWHHKAVDLATRLLAYSTFDNNRFIAGRNAIEDDLLSFGRLNLEFTVEVIDLLHEYCFVLRKLIERAGKVDRAKKIYPHEYKSPCTINRGGTDEREVELCANSLWWILGRVIHSKSVMVLGGDTCQIRVYHDGKTRETPDGLCFVDVESDFDNGTSHVLHVPSLVGVYTFSALRRELDEIVAANKLPSEA